MVYGPQVAPEHLREQIGMFILINFPQLML